MIRQLFFIIIPLFSFSQLDYNNYIISNYTEELEWNDETNQFEIKDQMFSRVEIFPEKSYYTYKVNYGEIERQVFWEYIGKDELNMDVYFTRLGEKIIFNYDDKEIWVFYDYNKQHNKYKRIKVLSNIKFRIKKSEYIPQTIRYTPQSIPQ